MKRILIMLVTTCALLTACGQNNNSDAMKGGGGSIDIMSPADGAKVSANQPLEIQYKVNKSPEGNHVHISVDNGQADVVRQMEGTYKVPPLSPGEHTVTIMEVTSGHAPTGVQAMVHVMAE